MPSALARPPLISITARTGSAEAIEASESGTAFAGVLHPERHHLRRIEHEDHAGVRIHLLAEHETAFLRFHVGRDFDGEIPRPVARVDRDRLHRQRLRRVCARRQGQEGDDNHEHHTHHATSRDETDRLCSIRCSTNMPNCGTQCETAR